MNMETIQPGSPTAPITEADLHAWVDHQLAPARRALVDAFLATRPEARAQVQAWQQQNEQLRAWLNPVLDEPLPLRLPLAPRVYRWPWRALAAGFAVAALSGGSAWWARGALDAESARLAFVQGTTLARAGGERSGPVSGQLSGFAHRAAVAHVVYSPDVRRPVEVGADQEQALVAWLTKRMGTAVRPPALGGLGYELIGGRLLPGERGPVAQFMYGGAGGERLTLYVTREVAGPDAAFRFGSDGPVNVFYWIDGEFGYAISAGADRNELMNVAQAVYRQLRQER